MPHRFVVLVNDELKVYDDFDKIPMVIDNVIEFSPEFIPPPHTHEQHEMNSQWEDKLKELMKRETK
jgi:hypothetical protein